MESIAPPTGIENSFKRFKVFLIEPTPEPRLMNTDLVFALFDKNTGCLEDVCSAYKIVSPDGRTRLVLESMYQTSEVEEIKRIGYCSEAFSYYRTRRIKVQDLEKFLKEHGKLDIYEWANDNAPFLQVSDFK